MYMKYMFVYLYTCRTDYYIASQVSLTRLTNNFWSVLCQKQIQFIAVGFPSCRYQMTNLWMYQTKPASHHPSNSYYLLYTVWFMNHWGCSLICWHVHTSPSYLHSATEVRMPKQSDSVEGRELWPLDTNLLKTPVAGREWVWKRFLWIPGILLVHSTWSPPPKKRTQKAGTRARQEIWLIRLLSDVPKASVCSCISISSSSWLFGPWPLAWLGCFWPCQWMMPYWFLS